MTRTARIAAPIGVVLVAVLAFAFESVLAGRPGGAASAWTAPIGTVVMELAAITTVGALAMALAAARGDAAVRNRFLGLAAICAGAWTLTSAITGLAAFIGTLDSSVTSPARVERAFLAYATDSAAGVAWVVTTVVAAVTTVLCVGGRSAAAAAVSCCVAVAGLVAVAEQLEPGGRIGHAMAVSALSVQLLGLAGALGSCIALVAVRGLPDGPSRAEDDLGRWSGLAAVGLVVAFVGGVIGAAVRLGGAEGLASPYGVVVIGRLALFAALVALALAIRRRTVRPDGLSRRPAQIGFLAVGGVFVGFGVALTRITAPSDGVALGLRPSATPAEVLTGEPLPGPLGVAAWFGTWSIDPVWCAVVVLAALGLVLELRRRRAGGAAPGSARAGRRAWPLVAALVVVAWATNGAPAVYGRVLLSVFVVQTVLLVAVAPLLASWGAPLTLAGRGGVGGASAAARVWRLLRQPVPATVLVVVFVWVQLGTDVLRATVANWIAATLLHAAALLVGALAAPALARARSLSGAPLGGSARLVRIVCGVVVGASFAAVGVLWLGPSGLVQASWFGATGRTWGPTPLEDQSTAGIVLVVVGAAVAVGVAAVQLLGARRGVGAAMGERA